MRGYYFCQFAEFITPVVLVVLAAREVWRQHERMTLWPAVWATVIAAPPAHSATQPVALGIYQYEVNGRRYTRFPRPADREAWARTTVSHDPPARFIELHYNPGDPKDVVVGRGYRFGPYFFLGFSTLLLAVCAPHATEAAAGAFFRYRRGGEPPEPGRRLRIAASGLMLLSLGLGVVGLVHYFRNCSAPIDQFSKLGAAAYGMTAGAIGAWAVVLGARSPRSRHAVHL